MSTSRKIARRDFLRTATVTSAGAIALPYFVPASALGLQGKAAPSDRIVMACIGVGGQGSGLMRGFMGMKEVQMIAVCDVDKKHLAAAQDAVNKKNENKDCQAVGDFREIAALENVDAVVVATPDHWHALASIACLKSGKDVYCEKPLVNSVAEGRAVCNAVTANKDKPRILQCGSHERSTNTIRLACEQVRNGKLGKIHTVRINLPTTDGHHKKVMVQKDAAPEMKPPEHLNYDMWLGHTPMRPYRPFMPDEVDRGVHFWWRFNMLYGGGEMTDRGAHVIDLAQLGLGKDDTGPVTFEAKGERSTGGVFDAFFNFSFVNTYADGVKLIGSTAEPRGLKFEGENGWIFVHVHGGKLEASDPNLITEDSAKENKIQLGRSPGHQRNFIDCVKSRQPAFATAEIGHRTASLCHLNNIAMLTGRKLTWDPAKEQIANDSEANALLKPKMRSPWTL